MPALDWTGPKRLLTAYPTVFASRALPGIVSDVLNFALMLEYLEAEFYAMGLGTEGLVPPDTREVFDQIRKHEVAHVAFLQSVLKGQAHAKPQFDFTAQGRFGDVFSNPATFMALAQGFEDTGVRAYKGQAASLMGEDDVLRAALRIHAVEARHAAQVRRLRGQKGWITGTESGDLPPRLKPIYEGEDNRFNFILAPRGKGPSMTEAFDEPLTKGEVLNIVKPFIGKGATPVATGGR